MVKMGSGVKKSVEAQAEQSKEETKAIEPKATDAASIIAAIHKAKGKHTVTTATAIPKVLRQETGIFEFDFFTGGGFPRGRYTIVYGPESSNKTNICLKACARAQKRPAPCNKAVWVDLERTFDPSWAAKMGVDIESLIVVSPSYGEEAVDIIDALVRADDVAILVVDSLAALVSSKEIGQSTETADVGASSLLTRRLVNKLMYAFGEEARKNHFPCVVLVNQIRFKIGAGKFENPEIMPNGEAQKFLASLRVRMSASNKIVKEVNPNVHCIKETRCIIKKAKVGVISNSFSFDMWMMPSDGVTYGETQSWGTVQKYLKELQLLAKGKKDGWVLEGETYPTLAVIADRYEHDDEFKVHLQGLVIKAFDDQMLLVDEPVSSIQDNVPGMMFQPTAATPN